MARVAGLGAVLLAAVVVVNPGRAQLLEQNLPNNVVTGQGVEPGVDVTTRVAPDYEAGGVRAGSIIMHPIASERVGYESNVLGTPAPHGSAFAETDASLQAATDWSRNGLNASVMVHDVRYASIGAQSYTNLDVRGGGKYEIGRDVATLEARHVVGNQTARDLDTPQLDQALSFQVDGATARYAIAFNRLTVTPSIDVARYRFDSGTVQGASYSQVYRNRTAYTPSVYATYEFDARRRAVLLLQDSEAIYRTLVPGIARRDYNDALLLGGLDYDVTGLIRVRALGGYEARTFSSSAYRTIQAPIVAGEVRWAVTGLTALTGTVSRRITDSSDEATAGVTVTSLHVRVDHEYLRNVLLRGDAGVDVSNYSQGQGDQTLFSATAQATYLLNRNARVSGGYEFLARDTSQTSGATLNNQPFGRSYTDHRVSIQLRLGL